MRGSDVFKHDSIHAPQEPDKECEEKATRRQLRAKSRCAANWMEGRTMPRQTRRDFAFCCCPEGTQVAQTSKVGTQFFLSDIEQNAGTHTQSMDVCVTCHKKCKTKMN